jgi:hypothetical protein
MAGLKEKSDILEGLQTPRNPEKAHIIWNMCSKCGLQLSVFALQNALNIVFIPSTIKYKIVIVC